MLRIEHGQRKGAAARAIGMGSTKTLAKLANHLAKTAERKPGSYPSEMAQVCDLGKLPESDLEAVFATTEVAQESSAPITFHRAEGYVPVL